jgi:hypothetical protein
VKFEIIDVWCNVKPSATEVINFSSSEQTEKSERYNINDTTSQWPKSIEKWCLHTNEIMSLAYNHIENKLNSFDNTHIEHKLLGA